jgi:hypothetical protein
LDPRGGFETASSEFCSPQRDKVRGIKFFHHRDTENTDILFFPLARKRRPEETICRLPAIVSQVDIKVKIVKHDAAG